MHPLKSDAFSMFDMTGKVAVVTGGGGGLGGASSQLLAEAGASVVCSDVDEGLAGAKADEIGAAGGTASAFAADVSRPDEAKALIAHAVSTYGRVDAMVNAAAIIARVPLVEMEDEDLERILSVNLLGVFYCCRAAAKVMIEQESGSIMNFASEAIDKPIPGVGAYAIAKVGATQIAKTMALELAPKKVRVNTVAPGWVRTPMTEGGFRREDGSVDLAGMEEREAGLEYPLGATGTPRDIANAVLFLASPASRWMTGQIVRINGGGSMPW